jgi:hypothetical protein
MGITRIYLIHGQMTQMLLTHLIIFSKKNTISTKKKKNWAIKAGGYNFILQQDENC